LEDELEDDDAPPIKQQKVKEDRKLVRRYSPPSLFDEPDVANIQEEQER